MSILRFEAPIIELKKKISDLKDNTAFKNIDISDEISKLEEKLKTFEAEIYKNITPWDRVQVSRHSDRPTALDYINKLFSDFMELHGDRTYGDDPSIVGGIGMFQGIPVTVIGNQRGKNTKDNLYRNFGMAHPEGYRKAIRLMKQAAKFNRPIITFIDTKGAYPGKGAEERGQSQAIAYNLFEMSALPVPIISIVIGEGGSGGALGIGVSNHIYMLENSTYSVISPEGAASLLWKDSSKAQQAANTLKITAHELKELDIIDEIIPEVSGGAHRDIDATTKKIEETLISSLKELLKLNKEELIKHRYEKYRQIGHTSLTADHQIDKTLVLFHET